MLFEPGRTQFDLNFRLGDIPVRIHPWFWLASVLLGWSSLRYGVQFLVVWIVCVFVSILVHELGHVLMGRFFGSDGHIVLYSFGGLAIGSNTLPRRWQRIAVCFAGPLAGFLLFGLLLGVLAVVAPERFAYVVNALLSMVGGGSEDVPDPDHGTMTLVGDFIWNMFFINLIWGLVNLLPIYPLDGGQISRDVCEGFSPGKGTRIALWLSIGVAGLFAFNALAHAVGHPLPYLWVLDLGDPIFVAIFFGILAINNVLMLQQVGYTREQYQRDQEERVAWERDPDYWKKGRQDDDYWER